MDVAVEEEVGFESFCRFGDGFASGDAGAFRGGVGRVHVRDHDLFVDGGFF